MSLVQHFGYFGQACSLLSEYPPALNKGTEFEIIFEVGDYTGYPFQLSLKEAMRLFWGAKKWRMSFDYDYEVNLDGAVNPDTFGTNIIAGSYAKTSGKIQISGENGDENHSGFNFLHSAENEKQLLCRAQEPEYVVFGEGWSVPVTYERRIVRLINDDPYETTTEDTTFVENLGFGITTDLYQEGFPSPFSKSEDPEDLDLWMKFAVFVERRSAGRYDSFIGSPAGTIDASLNYLGTTKTIKLGSISPNQPTEERIVKSEISNVVIEPMEWWTYNGKFDPETGLLV